jgi:hypothetical protein
MGLNVRLVNGKPQALLAYERSSTLLYSFEDFLLIRHGASCGAAGR